MNAIENAINDLLDRGRPLCCIVEDVRSAFFMGDVAARNLIQIVLFERTAK